MKEYSFTELRKKTVVNVSDGRNLGHLCDIVFTCTGQVMYFVAPGKRGFFRCQSSDNIFISWRSIIRVGEDVILVEINSNTGIFTQNATTEGTNS